MPGSTPILWCIAFSWCHGGILWHGKTLVWPTITVLGHLWHHWSISQRACRPCSWTRFDPEQWVLTSRAYRNFESSIGGLLTSIWVPRRPIAQFFFPASSVKLIWDKCITNERKTTLLLCLWPRYNDGNLYTQLPSMIRFLGLLVHEIVELQHNRGSEKGLRESHVLMLSFIILSSPFSLRCKYESRRDFSKFSHDAGQDRSEFQEYLVCEVVINDS